MMQYSWPSMLGCHAWLLIIANISTDSSCNIMVIVRIREFDFNVKIEPLF